MRCLYCRRPIGSMRRMVDREFCCSDQRRRFKTSSARVLRDAGELLGDYDDYLAVLEQPKKEAAKGNKFSMITAAMVGLIVGLTLWIVPSGQVPISTGDYTLRSSFTQILRSWIPDTPKINLRQDFRIGGLGEWLGGAAVADAVSGSLRTDNLRLWRPTLPLADYQMDFQAAIERKAVGWAFRAGNLQNYYATKLTVSGKDGARAEIERFVVVAGREVERVRLPIPVPIRADTLYRVRMRVKGDQFVTSVDGQVIDSWRDRRLRTGGVGFFAERGEQASVRWVSLSEPDSFFSRLLSLGFVQHPLHSIGNAGPMFVSVLPQ
jgi:hypothetical protein